VARRRELERILREGRLRTVFQPIIRLDTGAVAGYEALVRGPQGSSLASAESLVSAAYEADLVVEFDWLARATACRSALAGNMPADHLLFINIEPVALASDCPRKLWPYVERAFATFPVVLEVTERALGRDPVALTDGLARYQPFVAGFALDDVGTDAVTVSMLPLVSPGVIKLDLRVTQSGPTHEKAELLAAVHRETDRTGAMILCEGIENTAHLDAARQCGAVLGQGYLFGRPGPLPGPNRLPRQAHGQADAAARMGRREPRQSPAEHSIAAPAM